MKNFNFLKNVRILFLTLLISKFGMSQNTPGETFASLPANSPTNGYNTANVTWTGDNSVSWTHFYARTDRTMTVSGTSSKCITLNNSSPNIGSLTSASLAGGMGTLTFNYVRDFTGTNARSFTVKVNGITIETITVDPSSDIVQNYSKVINVAGNVVLNITNGGSQVKFDNIAWTAYSCAAPPEVTSPTAAPGISSAILNWTNPLSCADEVMVVAAPASNTAMPSGDGSSYTANAAYTSGTSIGNGYVVYKGTGSNVTVTGLTNGTTYYFKVFTRLGTTWSTGVEVSTTPAVVTAPTDYFRSIATGLWSANSTWESSNDNTNWIAATAAPTVTANTITIQNGHTVTINAATTLDQVVIKNGGTLLQAANAGIVTVNNGTGDDIVIENGGVFQLEAQNSLTVPNAPQTFTNRMVISTSAGLNVATGGIVRIGSGDGTYVGNGFFGIPTNTTSTWQDGAIFEWNNNSNLPAQGVFFVNSMPGTTPIVKTTVAIPGYGGSGTNALEIRGRLEANNVLHIGGASTKLFRDGIINTDSVVIGRDALKVTIGNGTATTAFSGAGPILIPDAGLDIAASTLITLTGNKKIEKSYNSLTVPTVTLLADSRITLGANNLTIKGKAASSGGHIVTDGLGKLRIDSIDAAAGTITFPVGPTATNYNPVTIANSGTMDDFSVNVAATAPGCGAAAGNTANLLFDISEATTGGSYCLLSLDFTGAANLGGILTNGVIAHCNGSSVDVSGGLITGNVISIDGIASFSPFFGTNDPVILPVTITSFTANELAGKVNVNWAVSNEQNIRSYIIERSANGVDFNTLQTTNATRANSYATADITPMKGANYYRLKIVEQDGSFNYSRTIRVDVANVKADIKVFPTVTSGTVNITSNTATLKNYYVVNAIGAIVRVGKMNVATSLDISDLKAGVYQLKIENQQFAIIKQ